jgi:hypothetical protein
MRGTPSSGRRAATRADARSGVRSGAHPGIRSGGSVCAALRAFIGASGGALAAMAAHAAEPVAPPPGGFAAYTPRVTATRIDDDEAPRIDGDLSDAAWAKSAVIDQFYQVEPVEGATPSQPTRAYVVYDSKYIYIGIYNFDNEPDKIVRRLLERDSRLQDEDAVRVFIDSFGTFRDGYFFATNANGARVDGLIENNVTLRTQWDTIWNVRARVVEDGWIAEFAIPFQSISFDNSLSEWGFQILRTIRRTNEEIRWSNIDRSRGRIDITNAGRLEGVTGISSGIGLEAQLFVTGSGSYDWETGAVDEAINPSANIFYKLSSSLTGSLTFNTDFSDAPLDARQVNTGRFSLFFPETRDFFLQDASVFEFGGRVFEGQPNGLPFFSRRIGITAGRPVDIIAGAKLSGKAGPANIGLISARTGESGPYEGQFLSAARASVPLFAESKAGVVLTYGDPTGGQSNAVMGADFQYKNSARWPGTLFVDTAYIRSFDDGADGVMAAFDAAYDSQVWNWNVRVEHIGPDYNPRLGFVNRTGVRRYFAKGVREFRPDDSWIRRAEIGFSANVVTDLEDTVEDRFYNGWAFATNNDGDEFRAEIERGFLDIREAFKIAGELDVPVGQYAFTQYEARVATTRARPVGVLVSGRVGEIFGGDFLNLRFGLGLAPNKHFRLGGEYSYQKFDLPTGNIGIHLFTVDTTIAFTPFMILKTDVQYDNISEGMTFFSRFIFEPTPYREIFVALGHSALIERDAFPQSFRAQGTNLALRLGQTLRF